MKKIYNLNENDLKNLDLKNDWDYRVEKYFGTKVPEIEFSFIKENILDTVMNDIEKFFQNKTGIVSSDYTLTCESLIDECVVYINIILDTGIESYTYCKTLESLLNVTDVSFDYLQYFDKQTSNFTEKGITVYDFEKEFFQVWSFLPIHSSSIKNYSVNINIFNETGWDGTLDVSLYNGNIVTLRPVVKQEQNIENLESGYMKTIIDFVNKIKLGNIKD